MLFGISFPSKNSKTAFLLHKIYEEILRYTNSVKTDETARVDGINPDIIFTNEQGQEIALEIETGSNLEHHKEYLIRKAELLTKQYGNKWHFILTNAWWRQRYTTTFGRFVMLRHHIPQFLKRQFPSKKPQHNGCQPCLTKKIDDKNNQHNQVQKSSARKPTTDNLAVQSEPAQNINKTKALK